MEPGEQIDIHIWKTFRAAKQAVDEVLGGMGGYLNEGDYSEENWQDRYLQQVLRT